MANSPRSSSPVFKMIGLQTGKPITGKRVGRIVSKIGKKAGVVVNRTMKTVKEKVLNEKTGKPTGQIRLVEREVVKYASAHDLRRSFGTRWAPKVKPATLQLLMRHASIETTLRYYVAQDAADVADELWATWGGDETAETSNNPASGNTSGNTRPQRVENETGASIGDATETP